MASPRVSVFIDGDLLSMNHIGFVIDWMAFRDHMRSDPTRIVTFHYHGIEVVLPADDSRSNSLPERQGRKLHDWLKNNGYRTSVHDADLSKPEALRKARGRTICSMTIDIMKALQSGQDVVYLVTADAAFVPLIEHVNQSGAMSVVIYDDASCAARLKRAADQFIDIVGMRSAIAKPRTS